MIVTMQNTVLRTLATLSLTLVLGLARAQAPDDEPVQDDPPDRAARLSYIQGDVSMQPAGEEDWGPAIVNRPLTTGDKLWTDENSRAEIYVGPAAVRLDGNTGFSFLNVDDDTIQMRMTAGVINVNVRDLDSNDDIEIDTPNLAVSLMRPGNYRVEVNDAGDTTVVKVSSGQAEATGEGQDVVVHNQQVVTFRGTDRLAAQFGTLGAPDDFDGWALDREHRDDRVASSRTAQYVSPDVTGYEDLDDNGSWSNEPEYGYVWTPTRVAVDWSPYRYGRWVWVSPWGWTWIDDAPWGYAPFHYGRWARVHERWCWVPGPRHVRAVYAPALVGWIGGGPGISVSVSFGGGIGWFPLGPREVYVPVRRYSPRYWERVNYSNTVVSREIVHQIYENRGRNVPYRWRGDTTVVTRTTFTSAGRVGNNRVRVSQTEIERAPVGAGPHIQPDRESRLGGAVRTNVRMPPRTVVDRQVVVRRAPPASAAHFARNPGQQRVEPRTVDRDRPRDVEDRGSGAGTTVHQRPERTVTDRPSNDNRNDRNDRNDRDNGGDRPGNARVQPAPSGQPNVVDRSHGDRPQVDRPRDDRPPRDQHGKTPQQSVREQPINREPQERDRVMREQQHDAQVQQREHNDRPPDYDRPRDTQSQAVSRQAEQRQQQQQQQQQQRQQGNERPRQERPQERQQERPNRQESKHQDKPRPQDREPRDQDSKRN